MWLEFRRPNEKIDHLSDQSVFRHEQGFVENWTKGPVCKILSNHWFTVCPCFQTLWEYEIKWDGLIHLKEERLSHHSTKFVPWSLLASLIQIDSDN